VGLKLNGRHQLPAYDDQMNLLEGNKDTTYKNTDTIIGANKEVDL
jgi:hypothetical protein